MSDVKANDIIVSRFSIGDTGRQLVVGRLESMIWTRVIFSVDSIGPIIGPFDIDDLETYGWTVEEAT